MSVESGTPNIPPAAWSAFWDATDDRVRCNHSAAKALEAAAPLIVAAAFEQFAAEIDSVPDPAGDAWLRAETAGRREVKRGLRARASVLRGEGDPK